MSYDGNDLFEGVDFNCREYLEQHKKDFEDCRTNILKRALSVETDKNKAESAVLELLKETLTEPDIFWAKNPEAAKGMLWASLGYFESKPISLLSLFEPSLWSGRFDRAWESLHEKLRKPLHKQQFESLLFDLGLESMRKQLYRSRLEKILESLWTLKIYPLQRSFEPQRRLLDELRRGCLWDSLWDSDWIAFYLFIKNKFLTKYEWENFRKLRCYENMLDSCFSVYLVPYEFHFLSSLGHRKNVIVLLEKPSHVKVEDGKLIEIEWEE